MDEWVNVKDRVPTASDVGEDGLTEAICWDGKQRSGSWWIIADNPMQFIKWRPMSK